MKQSNTFNDAVVNVVAKGKIKHSKIEHQHDQCNTNNLAFPDATTDFVFIHTVEFEAETFYQTITGH